MMITSPTLLSVMVLTFSLYVLNESRRLGLPTRPQAGHREGACPRGLPLMVEAAAVAASRTHPRPARPGAARPARQRGVSPNRRTSTTVAISACGALDRLRERADSVANREQGMHTIA